MAGFAKIDLLLLIVAVSTPGCGAGQTPSIQSYFQVLVDHYDPASLPKFEDVAKVTDRIAGASPQEITSALPAIFEAMAHHDDTVKAYAATALFAIAQRPDSAALLGSRVGVIGHDLLTAPRPETRAGEIIILGTLKPAPPPEVVPIFLTFLKRTDTDAQAQASGVVFELVQIAPEKPEVLAAIHEVLSRSLETNDRIGILNALGTSSVKDTRIITMMIGSLDDPDPGVRSTAIQALGRIGTKALRQAEPALQRLAADPKQIPDVVAAAKDALQRIHAPK
jgi:HEAT repeat protein